jgi:hypothetical protein
MLSFMPTPQEETMLSTKDLIQPTQRQLAGRAEKVI